MVSLNLNRSYTYVSTIRLLYNGNKAQVFTKPLPTPALNGKGRKDVKTTIPHPAQNYVNKIFTGKLPHQKIYQRESASNLNCLLPVVFGMAAQTRSLLPGDRSSLNLKL
ncbi:unnamed protein product [Sphenostylis stenocarpa]|uniref:Uncharacterized protein n=1 Tax=Sphenostylis stenocarpa TaxID=92480 RepID=A0AA86VRY5_9FABA|nr:unnamed protein product [Sphenostylis stenocarpa]